MRILKGCFENSRFNICGNLNMSLMESTNFSLINSDVNYILMPTMMAFKDTTIINNSTQRRNIGKIKKKSFNASKN